MLYIAEIEVTLSHYMQDENQFFKKIHLIEADTEDSAREKIILHYRKKDSPYEVSSWVDIVDISEIIK